MHELSIAEALIEQVQHEVAAAGRAGQVRRIELVVGRLSGVNPDSLRFAFELLVTETDLQGARLDISEAQAQCVCRDCGLQSPCDELAVCCPHCGSTQITIQGGRELILQSIELEEP